MINMTNIAHQKEKALLLIKEYISTAKSAFFTADMGMLSWYYLLKLASKNLLRSFSRTSITIGAIASGTAAIVFLVGFAYGLQTIVSDRLIQPNSLRLADVQSNSTALQLDTENLEKIRNISGVVAVAPAISMAGTLKFNDSKTEVIIVASRNAYMEYSNVSLVAGTFFSAETEAEYTGTTNDITGLFTEVVGQVAGVSTTSAQIKTGDRILDEKELNLRIQDGSYVPLRSSPEISSPILGYIKGSILDMYAGTTYWGDAYNSSGVQGRAYQDELGNWFGKWILIDSALVYQETVPTVYVPVVDESGNQAPLKGYISFENVAVLSNDETNSQKMLDSLLEDQGIVLGETTDSEVASDSSVVVVSYGEESVASDEAALLNSILDTNEPVTSEQSVTSAIVSIPRTEGKEVIISTGLLNIWELQPEDVMNKTISLGYILGGGIIPGLNGKVSTEELEYTVIGVAQQDDKPIVFAPLSDLESIGVAKYSIAKALSIDEESLQGVREKIESIGFSTQSISDTLSQVNRLFSIMRFLLGSFGMIAFIVALFGMFNTLTVSLLERIREIGVMKTLGTTNTDVVRLLIVESTLIGLAGGGLGIVLGILLGKSVDFLLFLIRNERSISLFGFPPLFLVVIFALSIIVGTITGLYPASKAKKISALNALRYE